MSARDIQIKAKKISELENLEDEEKISNSYVVVSYTENGAKENYKLKLQSLINNAAALQSNKEYAIHVYTNGAKLVSQSAGPYVKDSVVSLAFKPLENYRLTDNSYFITNCELISWVPQYGRLNFKITGTGNPTINITAESLMTYIINYAGLENMYVTIPKMSFIKNEEFEMTLRPFNGYELPNSINDFSISGGTLISYNKSTGKLRIRVIENMIITGSAIEKQKYNVNISIENGTYTINPNSLTFYKDDQFTITLRGNKGYNVPSQINVSNGTLISYENGVAVIKVDGTGDITVSGSSIYKEIQLTIIASNITYIKSPNQSTYHINDIVRITLTPNAGYILPKRSNIVLNGCTIVSYSNNELTIKITNDNNVKVTINAETPEVIETYYFGMTYAGEGYFRDKLISLDNETELRVFDENNTLININSPYISSTINVSPIPYNNFNITTNYNNVKYVPKFTFIAILLPSKYVIEDGDTYLFLDDNNNRYQITKIGRRIINFEELKDIYGNDIIDWTTEVMINNVSHYLLYFKDEGTAGEYKFEKIS
jgi:hypothetical protein